MKIPDSGQLLKFRAGRGLRVYSENSEYSQSVVKFTGLCLKRHFKAMFSNMA